MILTVKKDCDRNELQRLMNQLEKKGLELNFSEGANYIVLGLVGDTTALDVDWLKSFTCVKEVTRVQAPYKKGQPIVPSGRFRHRRQRRQGRRSGEDRCDRRSLLGRRRGHDLRHRPTGQRRWRRDVARRRVQAENLTLRFPGDGHRRDSCDGQGAGKDRSADRQ